MPMEAQWISNYWPNSGPDSIDTQEEISHLIFIKQHVESLVMNMYSSYTQLADCDPNPDLSLI